MTKPTQAKWRQRFLHARQPRTDDYVLAIVADALLWLGVISGVCAVLGVADDFNGSLFLAATAALLIGIYFLGRAKLKRKHNPTTSAVFGGLVAAWLGLVAVGAFVYWLSGVTSSVADAVVESAAGFSTTALTTLNPEELSVPFLFWRAATQWLGGLIALVAGVVTLPMALRKSHLEPTEWPQDGDLRQHRGSRQRQVVFIYCLLTALLGVGYAATALGTKHSIVHALTTISTGGFSSFSYSLVGAPAASQAVAAIGMAVAGSAFVAIWWALRGGGKRLLHSTELRAYVAILTIGWGVLWLTDNTFSWQEAAFATVSAASTTGYAISDWTTANDGVLALILIIFAVGSMIGSSGGGLHISRARLLFDFVRRELRRQLDPNSVVVVKSAQQTIDDKAMDRITGHQIAYFASCAATAFLLALFGVDLLGATYTGVSAIATHGPGLGVGAFGDLGDFSVGARLSLVPAMLIGRLSLIPLTMMLVLMIRAKRSPKNLLSRWFAKKRQTQRHPEGAQSQTTTP